MVSSGHSALHTGLVVEGHMELGKWGFFVNGSFPLFDQRKTFRKKRYSWEPGAPHSLSSGGMRFQPRWGSYFQHTSEGLELPTLPSCSAARPTRDL